ncbi:MAG: ABC transporter substrate-binding protein [Alphaproteobacteria bacterium TMED89]|nr:peptide ABC transporter substrate-binding protein [Rhodospirillaceae bacterium]RPH12973.1 MAG: ABC transporter substrate-binding protein [Alphaproteobacteria bacterium TMED89]
MLRLILLSAAALSVTASAASAETIRWARAGDSLTLDPHSQNEGPTHALAHQIYDPLLQRDMAGAIIPALATEWATLPGNPNVWRFKLREGVTFHDGAAFDAEDVVFSLNRAKADTSEMQELLASVIDIRAVDAYTVDLETEGANPLMINNLTNTFMMDKGWAEANDVAKPLDHNAGETTYATSNTNGTGAFMLVSRSVDEKTVLQANPNYWGADIYPHQVSEIIYTPIQSSATRVAALLSGEVDIIQDVPVQDLGRVGATDGLKVVTAAQNRVIFFGVDNVDGPTADVRVRQAMNMAINRDAIQQIVMRDQSDPTGVIMPPFVNGWTEALNEFPAYDLDAAKALMAEAGYGDGFDIALNCPNDRYINDEAICQAAVGMMGQIGINVTLDARPKAQHFPFIKEGNSDFWMLGWGVPTFDSHYIFNYLLHTNIGSRGSWNPTGFSNAEVDEMIVSLESETDLAVRDATIAKIWDIVQAEQVHLPIHNQVLNWGMKDGINFDVQPEDQPHFQFLTFN